MEISKSTIYQEIVDPLLLTWKFPTLVGILIYNDRSMLVWLDPSVLRYVGPLRTPSPSTSKNRCR